MNVPGTSKNNAQLPIICQKTSSDVIKDKSGLIAEKTQLVSHSPVRLSELNEKKGTHSVGQDSKTVLHLLEKVSGSTVGAAPVIISDRTENLAAKSNVSKTRELSKIEITNLCHTAMSEVKDAFNSDKLLIRVISPGSCRNENRPLSRPFLLNSGILHYVNELASNNFISGPRLSSSFIAPYAYVHPYEGSSHQINKMGILIANPSNVIAAGVDDINSCTQANGEVHCAHEAKGRGVEFVANALKSSKEYLARTNEIILSKIERDEFKGLFVFKYNNARIQGEAVLASLWLQNEAFQKHGIYLPIFIYNVITSLENDADNYSNLKLLTKDIAINDINQDKLLEYNFSKVWIDHLKEHNLLPEKSFE